MQLGGFGLVRVFKKGKGEIENLKTSDCEMTRANIRKLGQSVLEHRGLKQCCAAEKAQVRSATGQKIICY